MKEHSLKEINGYMRELERETDWFVLPIDSTYAMIKLSSIPQLLRLTQKRRKER